MLTSCMPITKAWPRSTCPACSNGEIFEHLLFFFSCYCLFGWIKHDCTFGAQSSFSTNCQELRVTQINTVVNWRHCSVSVKRKKGQKEIGHRKRVSVVALVIDFERPYMFDKEKNSFVRTNIHTQAERSISSSLQFLVSHQCLSFPCHHSSTPLIVFLWKSKKERTGKITTKRHTHIGKKRIERK